MMAIYVKSLKNHIMGEFVKIRKFILVIILLFSLKNDLFGLEIKILKFLGIQPIYKLQFCPKKLITKRFFQTSVAKAEGSLDLTNAFMSLTPPVNKDVKSLTRKPYLGVLNRQSIFGVPLFGIQTLGGTKSGQDFPRDKLS